MSWNERFLLSFASSHIFGHSDKKGDQCRQTHWLSPCHRHFQGGYSMHGSRGVPPPSDFISFWTHSWLGPDRWHSAEEDGTDEITSDSAQGSHKMTNKMQCLARSTKTRLDPPSLLYGRCGGRKSMGVGRRDHNQERSKRKRTALKAPALKVEEGSLNF